MVNAGATQGEIIGEKIPILGRDDGAVAGADESGDGEGRLLGIRNGVGWNREIGNVGNAEGPLEGGSPEMNGLGTCWVVPQPFDQLPPTCHYHTQSACVVFLWMRFGVDF